MVAIKIGNAGVAADGTPAIPTTKGTYTASVVYQEADGLTAQTEYTVEVKEDAIKSIKVSDPTKTSYLVGEKFDRSGAKVSFEMLSGRKVDDLSLIDTAKFKISDEDMTMSEVGEKTIKIDYVEKDKDSLKDVVVASYSIKVTVEESVPEKIEIGHRPKILYSTAESALDLTDGTLKVTYKTSDGTSVVEIPLDSEGITIEKPNFNNEGPQSLKVTYLGQTTTLNIIVEKDELEGIVNSEIDPISATVAPATKLEDFVKNGSISVKYSIREPKEVKLSDKSISISGWDETATDKISIKITYTENGMSKSLDFVVTVSNIKIKSLTPEKTKLVYIVNSANTLKADLDKINVTIAYDDADTKDDTTTLADTQKLAYVIKDSADAVVDIDKVDLTKVGTYTVVISSAVEKDSTVTGTITLSVENLSVKSIKATAPAVRVPVKGTFSPADQEVTIAYTNEGAESKTVKLGNTEYITYTIKDAAGKTVEAINTDAAAVYTIYAASVEDTAFKAAEVITVTVSDLEIDKITLTPDSVKVKKNGKIDLSGVKAMVSYKDGKADNKEFDLGTDAAEFVIDTDPVKIDTVGEYKVTVIPKADPTKTATLTINVYDVSVKDIIVTPTTLTLKKAESITPEALLQAIKDYVATVTYSDGTTETLNVAAEYGKTLTVDFSAVKINEVGSYDVAVALKADPTKTAKVTVVVTEKTITKFELNTTAIEVKTGDTADYSKKYEAVKVNVTYVEADKTTTDSIALNADDARIAVESNVDITKAGEYKVTVTSREDASKTATLTVKVVDGNKISDEDVEDIPEETPTKEDAVVVFTKSGDEWTSETGYASLSAALDSKSGIGKGTGDYMFVINKDVTEAKAVKFPSKATGITIVGDGTLTLSKATTINIKTANVSINCKINGDLNVTVGAGKTLKVGEKTGKLGKVTGNKSGTTLDVFGSVTIGSLSTFSKVYAEDGSIITIPAKGKVQNIADLKAEMILDGSVTVTGTTVNEGILHLTKNGTAKQPIAKVTLAGETKTFLDIIVGDEDTAIEGGMKVLYGSGKFNAAKNVNIINKDAQGNDLGAVAYNNNKEVRAENTEAITYQIGEGDEQNTSSFEALFNALANETGDVTVTVNSDAVISKANLPKKLASLTIKGASDDITITSNLTSIKVAYKLAFEDINIVAKNAKGADAALTISTTGSEMSFTNTTIIGKSITLAGNKKATTLKISDLNCVDKIQNFAVVEVTGLAGVAKTFTAETLKLGDDAFISFGNGCAVKITKLSGAGTIGLAKAATAKKFKAITLTSTDITEEGAVELVQIEFKATDSKALYGAVVEGTFETGTVIFADKSKGAIAYDKIFDATGLKDEGKLTNTKGKVTLG